MRVFVILLVLVGVTVLIPQAFGSEHAESLGLNNLASKLWYEHDYIIDGTILDIRGYGTEERIYDIQINSFFKPKESSDAKVITVYGFPNFYNIEGDRGIFFIKKQDAKWVFGEYGAKATPECPPSLMYHPPLDSQYTRVPASGIDFGYAVDCFPHYYREYLPQYMKLHGATEFPSPFSQIKDKVPANEVVCDEGLVLIQKYDGSPACVTESTKLKLIERGWASSQTTDLIDISTMFCGKSFEQIQSETTFHILNPQILPEGYSLKSTDDASLGTILLNYAKGNTCGTNPDTLSDGKIELVIRYDPDRTDESDGIAFLDSYKEKYEQNNIEYKTNITDEGLYIIGTGMGIGKSITIDENGNTIHEEQFDDPARVYVLDSNTNVGYKITAYFPLDQMMNIAKSLS